MTYFRRILLHKPHLVLESNWRQLGLDKDYNVIDMTAILRVMDELENSTFTKYQMKNTHLLEHINKLHKKANDEKLHSALHEQLASRIEGLIKNWSELYNFVATPILHEYQKDDPKILEENGRKRLNSPIRTQDIAEAKSIKLNDNKATTCNALSPFPLFTNPKKFKIPFNTRYFVVKSYNDYDIQRSINEGIWYLESENDSKILDMAYKAQKGPIYVMFFSVNGSERFCGMAEIKSCLVKTSYNLQSHFKVRWIYVKDVPNSKMKYLHSEKNDNICEVPPNKGKVMLQFIQKYKHSTSIFEMQFPNNSSKKLNNSGKNSNSPIENLEVGEVKSIRLNDDLTATSNGISKKLKTSEKRSNSSIEMPTTSNAVHKKLCDSFLESVAQDPKKKGMNDKNCHEVDLKSEFEKTKTDLNRLEKYESKVLELEIELERAEKLKEHYKSQLESKPEENNMWFFVEKNKILQTQLSNTQEELEESNEKHRKLKIELSYTQELLEDKNRLLQFKDMATSDASKDSTMLKELLNDKEIECQKSAAIILEYKLNLQRLINRFETSFKKMSEIENKLNKSKECRKQITSLDLEDGEITDSDTEEKEDNNDTDIVIHDEFGKLMQNLDKFERIFKLFDTECQKKDLKVTELEMTNSRLTNKNNQLQKGHKTIIEKDCDNLNILQNQVKELKKSLKDAINEKQDMNNVNKELKQKNEELERRIKAFHNLENVSEFSFDTEIKKEIKEEPPEIKKEPPEIKEEAPEF